ncbi:hypothetical protein HKK52_28600 [Pseudomonas sp. ADAK2]|uniref:hypothetical protein n=1 Tax=Pseudomonas TaxID=286 RepID=UPI001463EB28|nr:MULTISPECIES: hypothetical protein [unclassified Pseudomonas]QJI44755.1 hypothetical protein HKK53_28600 [Pseudomonas sp. ADAK7]QJI51056.1 hypothetical protein HKK52_28600 [Pseudomonas sp. ADAK2]
MHGALLLSNAIALTVLLGFQLIPEGNAEVVAQRMPHYLQLQKAPQLAVMSDQHMFVNQEVSQESSPLQTPSSERLIF